MNKDDNKFENSLSKWILIFVAVNFIILVLVEIVVAAGVLKKEPIEAICALFKSVSMPIVTLIIGHYFGSLSK